VDGDDGVDPAVMATMAWRRMGWRQRRRRGREKYWQLGGIQVKILWLWFMDYETGAFIGEP
jgi:hypothetical protein